MNAFVAVIFLAVTANADKHPLPSYMATFVDTKGQQYGLYDKYTKSITLDDQDREEGFIGLNVHRDQVIDDADLDIFYWHEELKYAKKKFLDFVDDNNDGKIELQELKDEFAEKPVRVALIECHYLKSKGLKQSCFADQLLTYASLVMDQNDVKTFYNELGNGDGISQAEAEAINHPKNVDKVTTAEELGAYYGNDGGVSLAEFTDYVVQESINDDFRRCRKEPPNKDTGNVDFLTPCLIEELVEYTNEDLTEMDIAVLYRAVDKDGKNGISKAEIGELPHIKGTEGADKTAEKVLKLIDMSLTPKVHGEAVIDYGEFRTYLRSPTVLIQLERECTVPLTTQKEELDCLFHTFIHLAVQQHDAIWLVVPDLEQQIAFEDLDVSNKGEIKPEDLKDYTDAATKTRFMAEIDSENAGHVCLEEWNKYMDIPHMVYGTADCLLKPRTNDGRGQCNKEEVKEIITHIKDLDNDFWSQWFKHYDTNNDNIITAADTNEDSTKFGTKELELLFLSEVGQGDDTVTLFEFTWYMKQQELAHRYEQIIKDGKKEDINEFHKVLLHWIQNDITEYDIQQFFNELDGNHNHELEETDFGAALWPKMKELLKKIDGVEPQGDVDQTVNFREFWLWLNSQTNPGQTPKVYVKSTFETACTVPITGENQQRREIECYVKHFKEHVEELAALV